MRRVSTTANSRLADNKALMVSNRLQMLRVITGKDKDLLRSTSRTLVFREALAISNHLRTSRVMAILVVLIINKVLVSNNNIMVQQDMGIRVRLRFLPLVKSRPHSHPGHRSSQGKTRLLASTGKEGHNKVNHSLVKTSLHFQIMDNLVNSKAS